MRRGSQVWQEEEEQGEEEHNCGDEEEQGEEDPNGGDEEEQGEHEEGAVEEGQEEGVAQEEEEQEEDPLVEVETRSTRGKGKGKGKKKKDEKKGWKGGKGKGRGGKGKGEGHHTGDLVEKAVERIGGRERTETTAGECKSGTKAVSFLPCRARHDSSDGRSSSHTIRIQLKRSQS